MGSRDVRKLDRSPLTANVVDVALYHKVTAYPPSFS